MANSVDRASKYLVFDSNGDPATTSGAAVPSDTTVSSYMETLLLASTAASARTTLGLGSAAVLAAGTGASDVPQNSDLGTASLLDAGTGASDVPQNSDLGSAAVLDAGTGAAEVPQNSDLGTAAYLNVGTGGSAVVQLTAASKLPAVDGSLLTHVVEYAVVREAQVANTDGGTFTASATWEIRTLNNYIIDTNSIVSLASNQFTLQIGKYIIKASAPAYKVDSHQIYLYDTDLASAVSVGTTAFSAAADGVMTRSELAFYISAASEKVYEIRHRCGTTRATDGRGKAGNLTSEVYTVVEIYKIG